MQDGQGAAEAVADSGCSPFSQRVWIALEAKGICYQYCETDRNNGRRAAAAEVEEDEDRLEPDPRNRVPAIRQGDWVCAESSVILEYVSVFRKGRTSSYQTPKHPG